MIRRLIPFLQFGEKRNWGITPEFSRIHRFPVFKGHLENLRISGGFWRILEANL